MAVRPTKLYTVRHVEGLVTIHETERLYAFKARELITGLLVELQPALTLLDAAEIAAGVVEEATMSGAGSWRKSHAESEGVIVLAGEP